MKREEGYYWVRITKNNKPIPAEWDSGVWLLFGDEEWYSDSAF
jgi:hypothetical protein